MAVSSRSAPGFPIDPAAVTAAADLLETIRVGVFIVTFEAEPYIEGVLKRIPNELAGRFAEITVIDDSSSDRTFDVAQEAGRRLGLTNLRVLRTPYNRGYGGNQKLGYLHAVENDFDYVVLLHGDGQYAPEYLPQIINAMADGPDAIIASRMINRLDALRGNMPKYKWVGNQVLTAIENVMLGSHLAEFHSGYRAYRIRTLQELPFELNADDFHFDTELLIQLIRTGRRIVEIPVPTFYGDEISRVNGMKYALNCVKAVTKARLTEVGLFYEPKFDFGTFDEAGYVVKQAPNSLHQHILNQHWDANWRVADLGANRGILSSRLAEKVGHVVSVDLEQPTLAGRAEARSLDLNGDFDAELGHRQFDVVLALDVIEHLRDPERAVRRIASLLKPGGRLYASTANIAFIIPRLSLLLGQFNYGKRGILDLTHTRLFTLYSFQKLLRNSGFTVRSVRGFGPPVRDMVGSDGSLGAIDSVAALLARWWPRLFAFNFLVVAERDDELEDIYARTAASERARGGA